MKKSNSVVFVSGNFYSLHPGHVRLLKFASESGTRLVVGVNNIQPSADVPPPLERVEALMELGIVDEAVVLDKGVEAFLEQLQPDVVIKGKEFEKRVNPEEPILKRCGGRLLFGSGEANYSGSQLLDHINTATRLNSLIQPKEFLDRHKIDYAELSSRVNDFQRLSVVVIGDVIVDEYISCEPLGMSREEPSIVVSPQSTERFVGGAGIVAAHAAALGANVHFLSVTGNDAVGEEAAARLSEYGVDTDLLTDDSRPTTLKQRVRAQEKTMLRVSHLRQHDISRELQQNLADRLEDLCKNADVVIFSDFNYGCLPVPLIETSRQIAARAGVPIVADSQSSSQVGDISRYRDALLLTPTEFEARLALRDQGSGLAKIGEELIQMTNSTNIFVKLGSDGVFIISHDLRPDNQNVDRLPAFNQLPRDVSGAGDSMLIASALALTGGASIWEAAFIGSTAAGIQTSRVGNIPISSSELLAAMSQ